MGQVDENVTCPIFFLTESRVQPVYQPYGLIHPRGSKIFAVKNQFFRKDRTNDLPLLNCRCLNPDRIQLGKIRNRLFERRTELAVYPARLY